MTHDKTYLVERVPVPRLEGVDDAMACDVFGEQAEWGFAIPWMYQALAAPRARRPMLRAPEPGDDFWPGALGYWGALHHLLVYGFGWSRPDRGLHWWYDAGRPVDDPKLALLGEIWDADGQLDWYAAWLWTTGGRDYLPRSGAGLEPQVVEVDDALMATYLEQGEKLEPKQLHDAFEKALREGHLVPVVFCSAKTGAGLDDLLHIFKCGDHREHDADVGLFGGAINGAELRQEQVWASKA